jgi:hypothetical protein
VIDGALWHLARGVRREQVTDDLSGPAFGNVPRVAAAEGVSEKSGPGRFKLGG